MTIETRLRSTSTSSGSGSGGTDTVVGTGSSGQVAYWNGTSSLTSSPVFLFDGTTVTAPQFAASSTSTQPYYYAFPQNDLTQFLRMYQSPGGPTFESNSGSMTFQAQSEQNMVFRNRILLSDLVTTSNVPINAWCLGLATASIGTGSFSIFHTYITKDQTSPATCNGYFADTEGDYTWNFHSNIGGSADNAWGFVVGVHGTNSVGFVGVADTSPTNTAAKIYQAVTASNNILELRASEHPLFGLSATTFTGNYWACYNSGVLYAYVDYVGNYVGRTFTSTVANGNAPLIVTSQTQVSNLNCTFLQGKQTGNSGNTIPLLDGNNTISNTNTFSSSNKLQFRDSTIYFQSSSSGVMDVVVSNLLNVGSASLAKANIATGATISNFGQAGDVVIGGYGFTTINDTGDDWDTRIEGNTDQNLIFVDAGNDRVGIGLNNPSTKFDVSGSINASSELRTSGNPIGYSVSVVASGSNAVIGTASALLDFGTTDPSITIDKAGKYIITARAKAYSNAATYGSFPVDLTLKVRRTNNTATDLSSTVVSLGVLVSSGFTEDLGDYAIPVFAYTTANSDDVLEIWGSIAAPDSGTVEANEASIIAVRVA